MQGLYSVSMNDFDICGGVKVVLDVPRRERFVTFSSAAGVE